MYLNKVECPVLLNSRDDGFDEVVTCIVKEIAGPDYIGRLCKMRRRLKRKVTGVKNTEKKKLNKNKVKILLAYLRKVRTSS